MKRFNTRVFLFTFPIAVSIAAAVTLTVIIDVRTASGIGISISIILAILSAVVFAGLVASYQLPVRASIWVYRAVMRGLAKRAVRSSLSHAMTQIPCLGILNRNGTVALRISIEGSNIVGVGTRFNVYDSVNDELWGRVEAFETDDAIVLCRPVYRINLDFWEHLEARMRFDTAPPGVYLVADVPTELMNEVERLLDGWR